MTGFLALPRTILDWFPGDFTTRHVFTELALRANWADAAHPLPRQKVALKRGQLVLGQPSFAAEQGLGRKQLRTCLARLEQHGKIGQVKGHVGTIITIIDYDMLFSNNSGDGPSKGPTEGQLRANCGPHQDKGTREQEKQEDTKAPSGTPYADFLEAWNTNCGKLAKATKMTNGRREHIKARLAEEPDLAYWINCARTMAASKFCQEGRWANIDWLIVNDTNHVKVAEGKYGSTPAKKSAIPDYHSLEKLYGD